jgi:DNA-binding PadR family transcriptional regulator
MAEPLTTYKLMVLALLEHAEAPLSGTQISDFFLEKEYTNYFTVQEALHELDESAFIKKESTHNNTRYSITPAGAETLSFFSDKLSEGIHDDISEYLSTNQLSIRQTASLLADYYKAPGDTYAVRCQLKEKEQSRIDLTITVPNRELAEAICDNWHRQSEQVYEYLMDLLVQ